MPLLVTSSACRSSTIIKVGSFVIAASPRRQNSIGLERKESLPVPIAKEVSPGLRFEELLGRRTTDSRTDQDYARQFIARSCRYISADGDKKNQIGILFLLIM